MVKTVIWDSCKDSLCAQAFKILGPPEKEFRSKSSVEFVSCFSNVSKNAMLSFLKTNLEKDCFIDSSLEVCPKENKCLFIEGCEQYAAIDIILRYLNCNKCSNAAIWCYLDINRQAIVHFVNRNGWFAEAYFLSDTEASAIHLVQNETLSLFIPVVFTTNLSEVEQNVFLRGEHYLQDYLPTQIGDLLSKKSGKRTNSNKEESGKKGRDKWDNL